VLRHCDTLHIGLLCSNGVKRVCSARPKNCLDIDQAFKHDFMRYQIAMDPIQASIKFSARREQSSDRLDHRLTEGEMLLTAGRVMHRVVAQASCCISSRQRVRIDMRLGKAAVCDLPIDVNEEVPFLLPSLQKALEHTCPLRIVVCDALVNPVDVNNKDLLSGSESKHCKFATRIEQIKLASGCCRFG
jgi:hypothetical protein